MGVADLLASSWKVYKAEVNDRRCGVQEERYAFLNIMMKNPLFFKIISQLAASRGAVTDKHAAE